MNKQKTQIIITGIVIFILGTSIGFIIQPEPEIKYVNNTIIEYKPSEFCLTFNLTNISINVSNNTLIPLSNLTPSKYSDKLTYKYGGIPSSINNSPNDAVISKELTEKNNKHTIAIDNFGNKWYFVGEWGWFNQSEYDTLPYKNKIYDVSPYWGLINN